MKTCTRCGETKPLNDFHIDKRVRSGRRSKCKACQRAQERVWDQKNAKRKQAYEKRHEKRHPEKARARRAINDAIRRGKLSKPSSCDGCDQEFESRLIHGHHADYDKPLEVEWLCRGCHVKAHRKELAHA